MVLYAQVPCIYGSSMKRSVWLNWVPGSSLWSVCTPSCSGYHSWNSTVLTLWLHVPAEYISNSYTRLYIYIFFCMLSNLFTPKAQGCTILESDEHHWRRCLWDSSSSSALSSSTARSAGTAPEEHWGFLLHLKSHTWNACHALCVGCSAGSRCWETNLSLGYQPEFVFCWCDGELWQWLPNSRASWQPLP